VIGLEPAPLPQVRDGGLRRVRAEKVLLPGQETSAERMVVTHGRANTPLALSVNPLPM
jgi:hypothetical protein